jgi:hypothetical protein
VEELVLDGCTAIGRTGNWELVGAGAGWRREGAAGGGGDDGEQVELGDGGAGDVEALGVGAGVGRGEEEAGVVDQGVEEGAVGGGEAFEEVAGAEGEAEPEALAARTGEEGAAGEALGVDGVREVEVADVADGLMSLRGKGTMRPLRSSSSIEPSRTKPAGAR